MFTVWACICLMANLGIAKAQEVWDLLGYAGDMPEFLGSLALQQMKAAYAPCSVLCSA